MNRVPSNHFTHHQLADRFLKLQIHLNSFEKVIGKEIKVVFEGGPGIVETDKVLCGDLGEIIYQAFPRDCRAIKRHKCKVGDASFRSNFVIGVEFMASYLGFTSSVDFVFFAHRNPAIWGNKNGEGVWYNTAAWVPYIATPTPGVLMLQQITNHFGEVAARLMKYQGEIK